MTDLNKATGRIVSRLDNCWSARDDVEIAVVHTDRSTVGRIGNKAFKMARLLSSVDTGDCVLSFGGAWSNHLHALAYLGHKHNFGCVGAVRAGELSDNAMLQSMRRYGMRLHFVSRADYRRRDDCEYSEALSRQLGCTVWIPEGGSTHEAVDGCRGIGRLIRASGFEPTHVVMPVGTGATLAGVILELGQEVQVVGMPVVRDDKVQRRITEWLQGRGCQWRLTAPLTPAYGRVNRSLIDFIVEFHARTQIILDPVYTGKVLLQGLGTTFQQVLPDGARLMFVHTGGAAGNYGFLEHYQSLSTVATEAFLSDLDHACAEHFHGEIGC